MNPVIRSRVLIAVSVAALVAGLAATQAHAQTPSVSASVDRTNLTLSDVLTLTLRIEGISNVHPLPQAPVIDGLVLVGSERTSHQTFVQGALTAHFEFKFRYQPLRTGSIEISPINVILDKVVHITKAITVNVTGGTGTQTSQLQTGPLPQPTELVGQDFFAESEVDDENPYIGQQITYTLRFYSASGFARPIYDAPDFAGFWNPGKSSEEESLATVAGRSYTVTEATTILFPTLAGDLQIEPTNVSIRGGLLGSNVTEYPTRQIDVKVRPLPPNEPDAFTGAVGRYAITADLDKQSVDVGEPVTLTLTVSGEGHIESLPAPSWPEVPGWRAFDNDAPYQMSIVDGKVQGARKFERIFIPSAAGSAEFPPVEYAYFDPFIGEYATLTSQSLNIEVLPDPSSPEVEPLAESVEDSAAEVQDIRYIKPVPGSLGRPENPLTSHGAFWLLWLTPLAGIAVVAALVVYGRRHTTEATAVETSGAARAVLDRLATVETGASAADVASLALHGYLEIRLGRATSGLSAAETAELLSQRGANPSTSQNVLDLLNRIAEMRFSSHEVEGVEEVAQDVAKMVQRLEQELRE